MSEVKTEKLSPRVTSLQLGDSGDTITIPSGVTIANSGASSGFGGVSNIHMSSKNGDFALTSATWTKVIHNVNFTGSTNYNSTTGVYTVGTGEGVITLLTSTAIFGEQEAEGLVFLCLASTLIMQSD